MKKPFNLSMILILALVLLTGAATMPGPVGGSGGAKITGAASTIATANLTASRALVSNASGKVEASSVTTTELGLLGSVAANSIIARPSASPGAPSAVTLSASQLVGRGSTGDVAAISLGAGLAMSGTTLSATNGITTYDGSTVANAAVASITGLSGRKTYQFTARCITNAATNRIFFTVNSDTTETFTDGRQLLNATSYTTTTDTLLLATTLGNGVAFEIIGTVSSVYDGTNTHVFLKTDASFTSGDAMRFFGRKQISGDTALTSFAVRSNQANGLKSGCYFKAQEIQ